MDNSKLRQHFFIIELPHSLLQSARIITNCHRALIDSLEFSKHTKKGLMECKKQNWKSKLNTMSFTFLSDSLVGIILRKLSLEIPS